MIAITFSNAITFINQSLQLACRVAPVARNPPLWFLAMLLFAPVMEVCRRRSQLRRPRCN